MVKTSFSKCLNYKIKKEDNEIFDAQALIRQIWLNHPILYRRLRLMCYIQRNLYIDECVTKLSNLKTRSTQCDKKILIGKIIRPLIVRFWNDAVSAMR